MNNAVIRKIEQSTSLSSGEIAAIDALLCRTADFQPGNDLAMEGDTPGATMVVLEGMACRYRSLPEGRRQIMSFQIAGDWVDLHSYLLQSMDHSVAAITRCRVAVIPHAKVNELVGAYPHLIRALWRDTMLDGAVFREWVVNVGARDARERMAHLFCEVHYRLKSVGLATQDSFELPLTQSDLADALGISSVHTNRTLQDLRANNLVQFSRGTVTVPDCERLAQMSGFNPNYLHLHQLSPADPMRSLDWPTTPSQDVRPGQTSFS